MSIHILSDCLLTIASTIFSSPVLHPHHWTWLPWEAWQSCRRVPQLWLEQRLWSGGLAIVDWCHFPPSSPRRRLRRHCIIEAVSFEEPDVHAVAHPPRHHSRDWGDGSGLVVWPSSIVGICHYHCHGGGCGVGDDDNERGVMLQVAPQASLLVVGQLVRVGRRTQL
jgi:hypothetical protein